MLYLIKLSVFFFFFKCLPKLHNQQFSVGKIPLSLTRSGYKCHKSLGKALPYIKVLVEKSFFWNSFFKLCCTFKTIAEQICGGWLWCETIGRMFSLVLSQSLVCSVMCFDITSIMLWNVCIMARGKWEIGRKSSVDMFTLFKKKKRQAAGILHTHCPFSLVVILALLFICVQKFQTMLLFQLWICEAPLPT